MDDCIFCRIANGEVPARVLYRDENAIAIEDVNPRAPAHVLVLPVRHYATIADVVEAGESMLATRLIEIAFRIGSERGGKNGFRVVINTGPYGGQTVDHVHVHVLAGRQMTWPPG